MSALDFSVEDLVEVKFTGEIGVIVSIVDKEDDEPYAMVSVQSQGHDPVQKRFYLYELSEFGSSLAPRSTAAQRPQKVKVTPHQVHFALVGDDRPAPNGDEFETMMLRQLAR